MYSKQRSDGLIYKIYHEFEQYYVELVNSDNVTISGFGIPFQSEEEAIELIKLLFMNYNDGRQNAVKLIEQQVVLFEQDVPEDITRGEHERTIEAIRRMTIEIIETIKAS
ncbi:hypothetical protein [Paenibacillus pini]|uniref:Uncharacterized protein n=1 Tax=Paenibacillus pini JCM 16418 TaxID=1236976 RepID=W7YQM6_9BACL|nr:hypothetical protein [Paenibacillus pini]GAF10862.1 hypothetical protein JCM16418_5089 [Paenibacillus pini JCM 16418]